MINQISFQTAARTVDHLGREQIADAPTAVSELWKNAFDAYARNVELNIHDDGSGVATILDDGHGMNRDEFIRRWLVVGTESKATSGDTPASDRNGLPIRPKQGQKGIGRLSCANLAPVLLLLSKRRGQPCVGALVDWRLFENPFLTLADIRVPVIEIDDPVEILRSLPALVSQLLENLSGGTDPVRAARVSAAWASFDALYEAEREAGSAGRTTAPSEAIRAGLSNLWLDERHLERWSVWSDGDAQGTALILAGVGYDLTALCLDRKTADQSAVAAIDRFHETLAGFVDPYVDPTRPELNAVDPHFRYAVRTIPLVGEHWVLGSDRQLSRFQLEQLEHHIEGQIDAAGVFRGRVKAFGRWLEEEVEIRPASDIGIPDRADTFVGPFDLFIASMEFSKRNTTQTADEFRLYDDLAERYAGFLMYRDGLRVLPFGRPDNDFFEIESRRTRHAGREFWNHRQMFGRIALSRRRNPNLRDKAGREGLLDNRAAKALKGIVSNILMVSARRFFGTASDLRKELLPDIQDANAKARAVVDREKMMKRLRLQFRTTLRANRDRLPALAAEVTAQAGVLSVSNESTAIAAQAAVERLQQQLMQYQLPEVPKPLGALEDEYNDYRREIGEVQRGIADLAAGVDAALEAAVLAEPEVVLAEQRRRAVNRFAARVETWRAEIDTRQKGEFNRLRQLLQSRKEAFDQAAEAIELRLKSGAIGLLEASRLLAEVQQRMDRESADIFVPYIGALESLGESIDLQSLASAGMEEISELRADLERLNGLAQLGIAVEIVGHELESYDEMIVSGLNALPPDIRVSQAAGNIAFGHEGLADQLRFLSPLRLAGERVHEWITGEYFVDYLSNFFKLPLAKNRIQLDATDGFRAFRVYDQKSRLLPVFINLLNNSVYWLSASEIDDRRILLSTADNQVIVSDNGPGVTEEDISSLFSLFFTRRVRGGRGVGLYLSRANLAGGGHRIRYASKEDDHPLTGANFIIEFRGGEFHEGS
ncbi:MULTISPECIES: ATP-binding protein [Brevundimonas]|uniref:ATP-binding protein n=1 Tax=Brevundimonas pondensis TaxID=2774189 RepID=A0ABX7SS01_9CAUL|nr:MULTISPECIES: ATP-binding protein [Brevundimonas]QTC89223.1 ATP-binding protein [Brevundimonas pondensis]